MSFFLETANHFGNILTQIIGQNKNKTDIDGLMHDWGNFIANATHLKISCTKPLIYGHMFINY